jgi:ankyrin repeat protein
MAHETNCFSMLWAMYVRSFFLTDPLYGPLYGACMERHLPVIKFLLDHNADVNKQDTKNRMTPLHDAITNKQISACELNLEYEDAVSTQNIESGISMSIMAKAPEIRAVLEKKLKKRRKVILIPISKNRQTTPSLYNSTTKTKVLIFLLATRR